MVQFSDFFIFLNFFSFFQKGRFQGDPRVVAGYFDHYGLKKWSIEDKILLEMNFFSQKRPEEQEGPEGAEGLKVHLGALPFGGFSGVQCSSNIKTDIFYFF